MKLFVASALALLLAVAAVPAATAAGIHRLAQRATHLPHPANASLSLPIHYDAGYPYVVHDPTPGTPRRAIIFLHGSGSCGTDLNSNPYWDGAGYMLRQSGAAATMVQNDMIVILPLHPPCNTQVREWDATAVLSVISDASSKYQINPDHFYCSGYSMGGKGTWLLAMKAPDLCKKIIVAAGYTQDQSYDHLTYAMLQPLAHIPMRLFSGSQDTKQPPGTTSQPVYDILHNQLNAPDVVLEIMNTDHAGMSTQPWQEEKLWQWVTDQTAEDEKAPAQVATA